MKKIIFDATKKFEEMFFGELGEDYGDIFLYGDFDEIEKRHNRQAEKIKSYKNVVEIEEEDLPAFGISKDETAYFVSLVHGNYIVCIASRIYIDLKEGTINRW